MLRYSIFLLVTDTLMLSNNKFLHVKKKQNLTQQLDDNCIVVYDTTKLFLFFYVVSNKFKIEFSSHPRDVFFVHSNYKALKC